jgi:hypothetical protein
MRHCIGLLFLALISSISVAQTKNCAVSQAFLVGDRDGVTEKNIVFQGLSGRMSAHAFIPDRAGPVPGFAFSHSSIQYPDSRTDLLLFARALARGGSAVVMLDGSIDSQTTVADTKIQPSDVACAAFWLMANANLDPHRLAIGGPMQFPMAESFCPDEDKGPCWKPAFVAYWETSHEQNYARLMKTPEGQLWHIHDLPANFGLKDVPLELAAARRNADNRLQTMSSHQCR